MTFTNKVDRILKRSNETALAHISRFKLYYHLIALCAFVIGGVWSALAIEVDYFLLESQWLFLNLFLAAPIAIALNALGLKIAATLAKIHISFSRALDISSFSTISNLLPIPAGTVIQTSLLAQKSESLIGPLRFILIGHICSLAVIALACGFAVINKNAGIGIILALIGASVIIACSMFVFHVGGLIIAAQFIFLRIVRGALMIFRVFISFLALSTTLKPDESAIYTAAGEIGSLLVIFPTGLGASEMIAASFAVIIGESAPIAFLAMALNRLTGIAAAGVIAGFYLFLKAIRKGKNHENNSSEL